jgi:hypothetical protein
MQDKKTVNLNSLLKDHNGVGAEYYWAEGPRTVYMLFGSSEIPHSGSKDIEVDWIRKRKNLVKEYPVVSVQWSDLPGMEQRGKCLKNAFGRNRYAEDASIVIMCLLIHELEGMAVTEVIEPGYGGDYFIIQCQDIIGINAKTATDQIEVSGIDEDKTKKLSQDRLSCKMRQLFKYVNQGFVSVTTFKYPGHDDSTITHSYLHYVKQPKKVNKAFVKMKTIRKDKSMTPIDKITKEASVETIRGKGSLNRGDTVAAREHYTKAGEMLLNQASHAPVGTRHYLKYLAATNFFRGGEYARAHSIAAKIKPLHLPSREQSAFQGFLSEVVSRSRLDYVQSTRNKIKSMTDSGRIHDAMNSLEDHRYIYNSYVWLFLYSYLLAEDGDYPAVSLYLSRSIELSLDNSNIILIGASLPFIVSSKGDINGAMELAELLVKEIRKFATYCVAVLIIYLKAHVLNETDKGILGKNLLEYAKTALALLDNETEAFKSDDWTRIYCDLMLCNAAVARDWVGPSETNEWIILAIRNRNFRLDDLRELAFLALDRPSEVASKPSEVASKVTNHILNIINNVKTTFAQVAQAA